MAFLDVEPIAYPVCFFPGLPDSALRLSFLLSANRGLFYALKVFWVLDSGFWGVTPQEQDCCPRGGRFRGREGRTREVPSPRVFVALVHSLLSFCSFLSILRVPCVCVVCNARRVSLARIAARLAERWQWANSGTWLLFFLSPRFIGYRHGSR